jgi:hypothetical protein
MHIGSIIIIIIKINHLLNVTLDIDDIKEET